jgi:polar amino acid transport system substrate-binding protein
MKFLRIAVSAITLVAAGAASAEIKLNLINQGELRVLTNPIYPPMEFVNPDQGTLDGFDVDLINAIAKKLNLKVLLVTSAFQELQSGLQTGRGDMIISGISDNVKRQASMDFVDYLTSGPILFTMKANAGQYKQTTDLCGKTVAGSRSTSFGENVTNWSDANCVARASPRSSLREPPIPMPPVSA